MVQLSIHFRYVVYRSVANSLFNLLTWMKQTFQLIDVFQFESCLCYIILRCVNWDICFDYVFFFWNSDVTNQRLFFSFFFHLNTQKTGGSVFCYFGIHYFLLRVFQLFYLLYANISMVMWTETCSKCCTFAKSLTKCFRSAKLISIWL